MALRVLMRVSWWLERGSAFSAVAPLVLLVLGWVSVLALSLAVKVSSADPLLELEDGSFGGCTRGSLIGVTPGISFGATTRKDAANCLASSGEGSCRPAQRQI